MQDTWWFGQDNATRILSVAAASDGGWATLGSRDVYEPVRYVAEFIVRFDAHGKVLWRKQYDSDDHLGVTTLHAMSGGSLLLVGGSGDANVLARIAADGEARWAHTLSGRGLLVAVNESDDSFAEMFFAPTDDGERFTIARLDADGDLLWQTSSDLPGIGTEPQALVWSSAGQLVVAGTLWFFDDPTQRQQLYAAAFSSEGELRWMRTIAHERLDTRRSVLLAAGGDGKPVLLAHVNDPVGASLWMARLSGDGTIERQASLAASEDAGGGADCLVASLLPAWDGEVIVTGIIDSHSNASFALGLDAKLGLLDQIRIDSWFGAGQYHPATGTVLSGGHLLLRNRRLLVRLNEAWSVDPCPEAIHTVASFGAVESGAVVATSEVLPEFEEASPLQRGEVQVSASSFDLVLEPASCPQRCTNDQ